MMSGMRVALVVVVILACFGAIAGGRGVRVRGYVKRDGAYVAPHERTAPDGKPENNYGMPGNFNPNKGEITGGDAAAYLQRYYARQSRSGTESLGSSVTLPDGLRAQDGDVPLDELARADRYCGGLYQGGPGDERCRAAQRQTMATIMLPDYSALDQNDVTRGAHYCENLYGDDRAGFYNCFNRQLFGLSEAAPSFAGVDDNEVLGSRSYCEGLYRDDRAGVANCMRFQAQRLRTPPVDTGGVPPNEWRRSVAYCENLYRNDRGGVKSCEDFQRRRLAEDLDPVGVPPHEWQRSVAYCDQLYGDDRGGAQACKVNQLHGLSIRGAPPNNPYCENLYGNDRAGFWRCAAR